MNNNMMNTMIGVYTASLLTGAGMAAARMRKQGLTGPGTDTFEFSVEPSASGSSSGSPGALLLNDGLPVTIQTTKPGSTSTGLNQSGSQFKTFSAVI
jgi:hypothetical protein